MSESLIHSLLSRSCITIRENQNIELLIKKLTDHEIGALPVINSKGHLLGIISERDVVKNLASLGSDFIFDQVNNFMTKDVITCNKETRSDELMDLMSTNRIRHIPVINNKRPIAMVSIGDVVNRLLQKYKTETQFLKDYISL